MKVLSFINSKLNRFLIFENLFSFFFFFSSLLFVNNKMLYVLGIFDILFLYLIILLKLIKRKDITIVEVFLAFFFLYVIGTYIFFNNDLFKKLILKVYVENVPHPAQLQLLLMNCVLFIYTKIMSLPIYDIKFFLTKSISKNYLKISEKFSIIPYLVIPVFILFLFYLIRTFSNYSDFIENSGSAFSFISYFSFITSIVIIITDQNIVWNKRIGKTFLVLLCVALIAKIGSRTYAVYILFSLLINLKKRGMKFGNKLIFVLMIIGMFGILYQSLARFGMHGLGDAFSVLTLFGEFFLPAYSFYYYVNNPLKYVYFFSWTDFIVKLLPTKVLPLLNIDAYMQFYNLHNISIAPVGGLFLYGQLFYYFGIFSIIAIFVLSIYLAYYKNILECKGNLKISLILPIAFLILPRQLIYLLPRSILMIFIFYFFMDFILQKQR